jgi:hypothetical protein
MTGSTSHHIMKICFSIVAALAFLALSGAPALAQVDAFTAKISEKELKLENPTDMMWDKWLMWDIGFQRMLNRNMPYLEFTNDHPTDPIKEVHLTIGDTRFNFGPVDGSGEFALLGSTTPGFTLTSSTKDGLGDELIVNIGGAGLLPGELFRFKINIDVDPSFAAQYQALFGDSQPDFRTVLFDMNGSNVYDGTQQVSSADNAQAWVVFDPAAGPNLPTDPVAFADASVAAAAFFNNNLRQYRDMDAVLIFAIDGEVIPEPASAALLFVAAAFGLLLTRHSRRSILAR